MQKFFKSKYGLWLTAGLCCLLWGSAFPVIKIGYSLFEIQNQDTASIILFAGIRFSLAGVLTLVIFSFAEKRPLVFRKASLKRIAVLSAFQTVIQYIFFYLGLAFTTGSRGSVINASSVFFALFISTAVMKTERFSVNKLVGCIIGFAGVVLISIDSVSGGAFGVKGEAFILVSAVSYALSSVFIKKYSQFDSPAMLSGWQFMFGGIVMTVFSLAFGGRIITVTASGIALLVYLALVSALAYSLWSILLKYNEVSRVAVCGFMTPVFGFFLSAIHEKTAVGIAALIALALVVIGIITVNSDKKLNKTL